MELRLPTGCGNAPRIHIVADFTGLWAASDAAIEAMLAPECTWWVNGELAAVPDVPSLSGDAERVELRSVITHGREAACEGTLLASGGAIDFCHVIRFAGAAKTARVVEVRTYIAPHDAGEEEESA